MKVMVPVQILRRGETSGRVKYGFGRSHNVVGVTGSHRAVTTGTDRQVSTKRVRTTARGATHDV